MSRKKPFRVGRALTGLGLFATEPIKKKTLIVEYKGPRLTNDVSEKLEARGSRYLYEVNSRWTIDGSSRKNLGRYSNHSCRPNSEAHELHGKVFIRALRAIKDGEEITWNYGRDYFVNVITPSGCKCVKCREKRNKRRRELALAAKRRAARTARQRRAAKP
jgi:SET domain-containing protein